MMLYHVASDATSGSVGDNPTIGTAADTTDEKGVFMLGSSNPVFGSINREVQRGGVATASFGPGFAQGGYQQGGYQQGGYGGYNANTFSQAGMAQQGMMGGYGQYAGFQAQAAGGERPMTIDDVVTKAAITLGAIVVVAALSFFAAVNGGPGVAGALALVGGLGGFATVLVATLGRKMGSAAVTLIYALFEGLFVGAVSLIIPSAYQVQGASIMGLIGQAVLATLAVFFGMLVVYKTGAIRVTPRFTRFLATAIIGVLVLMLANFVGAVFFDFNPLRDGGPIAIIFSLVCIGLAAFSFLVDFDNADRLVRAGAPAKMAWGVALGLAVTLVWLYTEFLRLLSILNNR